MRTTLTIDDDVLTAAKAIAQQTDRTIGEVLSDLARSALRPKTQPSERNPAPARAQLRRHLHTGNRQRSA
jgi:hypothetical protein